MIKFRKGPIAALMLGIASLTGLSMVTMPVTEVQAGSVDPDSVHNDFLKIGVEEPLPASRNVMLGLNKTMIVEVPRDLRDVVVSNPEFVDAVVQSSNRVYLIAKQLGNANVFFFDENGEQILSVDIRIEHVSAPTVGAYRTTVADDTDDLALLLERMAAGDVPREMRTETLRFRDLDPSCIVESCIAVMRPIASSADFGTYRASGSLSACTSRITARRTAHRNIGFATKRDRSVASVTSFYADHRLIDKVHNGAEGDTLRVAKAPVIVASRAGSARVGAVDSDDDQRDQERRAASPYRQPGRHGVTLGSVTVFFPGVPSRLHTRSSWSWMVIGQTPNVSIGTSLGLSTGGGSAR